MKIRTCFFLLVLAAAATALATPQASKTAALRDPEIIDAQGYQKLLEQNRGKPVLVNFWATYCEPCRDELPTIERLRASLAGRPFVVLGVQMGGSARTAQDTAKELGLHFPLLVDRDSRATKAWDVRELPTSFLIGPGGEIAFTHAGEMDWTSAGARRRVETLLATPPP